MSQLDLSLKQRIEADMKTAMKAHEAQRLGTIRLILAAIKQREVDERITLDDIQVMAVIDKMLKQRRDSAQQFEKAGRSELLAQENFEIALLETYLPTKLSDTEIQTLLSEALTKVGATSLKDMGAVMAYLKPQIQGRADVAAVSSLVKEKLSQR